MVIIKVVCGIIYSDDKILICRRKINKFLGGYWEFPGGKIEHDELPEESLFRELEEELGMQVELIQYFNENIHDYGSFKIELIAYRCKYLSASFNLTDHDACEWIYIKDLSKWKLAPADISIAEKLIDYDAMKDNA